MSLVFGVRSSPDPLQASRTGRIEVVISSENAMHAVVLKDLTIGLRIGTYAPDLTASTDDITVSTIPGWHIRMEGGVCHATPDEPRKIAGRGYAIVIDHILVNQQVGTTELIIHAETGDGPIDLKVDVVKFPADFTLSNLAVHPEWVENGQAATLMWTGTDLPDVQYEIHYITDDQPVVVPVTWIGPFTTAALTNGPNTSFTLDAKMSGQSVIRQGTVAVRPRQPELSRLSATFSGERVTLHWSARYADHCLLSHSSVLHDIAGRTEPLPLDRMSYTVTAVFTPRRTSRDLRLTTQQTAQADFRRSDYGDLETLVAAPDGSLVIAGDMNGPSVYGGKTLNWMRDAFNWSYAGFMRNHAFAFRSDSARFFVGGYGDQATYARVYRPDCTLVASWDQLGPIDGAVYTPDDRSIIVLVRLQGIYTVAAETLRQLKTPFPHTRTQDNGLAISGDGRTIYVTENTEIQALDSDTGAVTQRASVEMLGPTKLHFWDGREKQYLIAGTVGQRLHIFTPALEPVDAGNALDFELRWFTVTAAELLIVKRWDPQHVYVFDLSSLTMKQTLDLPSSLGVAYGGGAIYTVHDKTIARNVPVQATAVP